MRLLVLGELPYFREIGSEISGFRGGSTTASYCEENGNAGTQIGQGGLNVCLVKSISKLAEIVLKYLSSAVNRAFDSLVKDIEDEDVELVDYLMYRVKD